MKTCPNCGLTHDQEVETCDCGHVFFYAPNTARSNKRDSFEMMSAITGLFGFSGQFVTPLLVSISYWLSLVALVVVLANTSSYTLSGIEKLLVFVVSVIAIRVVHELLIVVFKIHESLTEIASNTRR